MSKFKIIFIVTDGPWHLLFKIFIIVTDVPWRLLFKICLFLPTVHGVFN